MAAGNFIPTFSFAHGNVYYSTTAVTFSDSTALSANAVITTSNQVIQMENLEFTPPKGEVEVINLLGVETTTTGAGIPVTGTFQNQIYDQKSFSDAKLTGTLIFTAHNDGGNAALLPDFINMATGAGTAVSTTYHKHTFGDETTGQVRNSVGAVFVVMKNGSEEATLLLNNPVVNLGSIKPTGKDGYYQCDVEMNCLAKNCAIEIKDFD